MLVAILIIMGTSLWDKIQDFFLGYSESGGDINNLLSGRLDVFENVIEQINKHPILGNGVTYEKLGLIRAHNIFLQILYENGIIGFLGFILFLVVAIRRVKKAKRINKFYYAFFIATPFILINAMIEETLLGHFMVLLGLLFLADIKKQKGDN